MLYSCCLLIIDHGQLICKLNLLQSHFYGIYQFIGRGRASYYTPDSFLDYLGYVTNFKHQIVQKPTSILLLD